MARQPTARPNAIMITGTDDHDPLETMITIDWNAHNGTLERDHAVAERWARRPFERAA